MTSAERIKTAVERSTKALQLKPSLGFGTRKSKTRVKEGLTCEITEGDWKFITDMPEGVGGNASGPTPGVLGRAAFGSCLAITYMLYAAKKNIPIENLEVDVEADFDDGALLGTQDIPPGYSQVRYTVTIDSDASEEELMELIDDADAHSPYLDVFSRGQECIRKVNIVHSKAQ
ncbi:MAG: hypothetical protein C5B52_10520 [Bacteroidetes bacterium]|nr:MAG: hypothetical protein C5B52_10520 [Bacteroidota bacterium]